MMPARDSTGCNNRHKFGWIAVGYCEEDDFWFSSEGVFRSKKLAIEDLIENYTVDQYSAVRVPLLKMHKAKQSRG
jgi:hypothetical protein